MTRTLAVIVACVVALMIFRPISLNAQTTSHSTQSATSSPTWFPGPDEARIKENQLGTSTQELWAFLSDPEIPAERKSPASVVEAAIRLLVHRKPQGVERRLIELTPSLIELDPHLDNALVNALEEFAVQEGKPNATLLAATKSPHASVRAFAIRALLRTGGLSPDQATRLIENEDFVVRWQSAMGLIDLKKPNALPTLIGLIPDSSSDEARHLEKLLQHIAGNGPNPTLGGDKETRLAAQQSWLKWWQDRGGKITSSQISHGYTLAFNETHVGALDLAGNLLWHAEVTPKVWRVGHAHLLPNGNFLVAEPPLAFGKVSKICEFTRTGTVVRTYKDNAQTVEGLSDGRVLVCTTGLLSIFDRQGKQKVIHHERHGNYRMGRAKPNGGFALAGIPYDKNSREEDAGDGEFIELDEQGKVTRRTFLKNNKNCAMSLRFEFLPEDHVLICRSSDFVILNSERKVVGTIAPGGIEPTGVQRLANGNILVWYQNRTAEYQLDGKKVSESRLPYKLWFASRD